MKRRLAQLMRQFAVRDIEDAFVAHYLEGHGLNDVSLTHIAQARDRAVCQRDPLAAVGQRFGRLSLDEMATAFELLIPADDRKMNGAFFTPRPVASYIVQQGLRGSAGTVCDPSCGCGVVLIEAARQLSARHGWTITETVHHAIYGVDLCDYNVARASVLLGLLALERGERPDVWNPNLRAADSLTADWAGLFGDVMRDGGFDAVIGNPPYVRFQHLDEHVRRSLRSWTTIADGNYNLFYAFFELARELLAPHGQLSFIVPNSFFTLAAAGALREWFADTRTIREIVDFGHERVFDASVYTCIVSGDRQHRSSLSYARISGPGQLAGKPPVTDVPYAQLGRTKWNLVPAERQQILAAIRDPRFGTLGDLAICRGGVATLRDKLFMLDGDRDADGHLIKEHAGRTFGIESQVTVPCLRISDFADDQQLTANRRRILYPYEMIDGRPRIIGEPELRDRFPGAYAYLTAIRSELQQRDKGRKTYAAWYAYGRTQGLLPTGPAVYTPVYAARPRFLADRQGGGLFVNGLALLRRPDADEKAGVPVTNDLLQALLHDSPVLAYYMAALAQHISGGYAHYRPSLLHAFPVPCLTRQQAEDLVAADALDRRRLLVSLYGVPDLPR